MGAVYRASGRPTLRTTSLVEVRSCRVTRPADAMQAQVDLQSGKSPRTPRAERESARVAGRIARAMARAHERQTAGIIGYLD